MRYRPGGVTASSVILIVFATLGITITIAIMLITANIIQNKITSDTLLLVITLYTIPHHYSLLPEELEFIIGLAQVAIYDVASAFYNVNRLYVFSCVVSIGAAFYIVAAIGLLKMKVWGRYLALIVATLNIIAGYFFLVFIFGSVYIALGIVMLAYLLGDVKYEFE